MPVLGFARYSMLDPYFFSSIIVYDRFIWLHYLLTYRAGNLFDIWYFLLYACTYKALVQRTVVVRQITYSLAISWKMMNAPGGVLVLQFLKTWKYIQVWSSWARGTLKLYLTCSLLCYSIKCVSIQSFFVVMEPPFCSSRNNPKDYISYVYLTRQDCFPRHCVHVFFKRVDDEIGLPSVCNINCWPKSGVVDEICFFCDNISRFESAVIPSSARNYKCFNHLKNPETLYALCISKQYGWREPRCFHRQHFSISRIVLIQLINV